MVFTLDSTLIAAVIASFLTVFTLLFGWLRSSFSELRDIITENESNHRKEHLDNLRRFEKISIALARLGSDNGIMK